MGRQPNHRLDDVRELRAMAHPLRVRLYYALQALEAATASRLAESVGESPALVSYHLRQLRDHGFVEEAPDLVSDRRERWWRPSTEGFRFSLPEVGDAPEARGAALALQRAHLTNQLERLGTWHDEQPAWGPEWSKAAFSSDTLLRLSPQELDMLHEELQTVIRAYRERGRNHGAGDASEGAEAPKGQAGLATTSAEAAEKSPAESREHIFLFLHAFPFRP